MKTLLLFVVCLAGAAIAQRPPSENKKDIDQAFRARREYTYRYETQVNTGNEPSSKLYTGFKLSCLARVQFITHSVVRVAFENINLLNFEQPVTEYEATKNMHHDTSLKEMVGPDALAYRKFLSEPFGFTYEEGHVEKVILKDDETWWSANTKKGFVSLFEVNLNKKFQLPLHVAPETKITHAKDIYTVLEKSSEGECATVYSIKKKQPVSNEMFVMKTRDFDNCVERPVYYAPHLYQPAITTVDRLNTPLSIQSHVEYNLKTLGRSKFIITNAVANEWITWSPYTENLMKGEQPEFKTAVNQTMYLIQTRIIQGDYEIPEVAAEKVKGHTLRMTVPGRHLGTSGFPSIEKEDIPIFGNKYDVYTPEKIHAVIRLIAENNVELTSEHALTHLKIASDMMRTSPKAVLFKVWNTLREASDDPIDNFALKVFFELLPTISTEPGCELVFDICEKEKHLETNCTSVFKVAALTAPASETLVRKLMEFIRTRRTSFSTVMKKTSYLTLGSFGFKVMKEKEIRVEHIDKAIEILMPLRKQRSRELRNEIRLRIKELRNLRVTIINSANQIAERIVKALEILIKKGDTADKILGLKALGNSGLPQSATVYKKFLVNKEEPLMLRVLSIMGFRRFTDVEDSRMEAIETVYDVVTDHRETHEIRNLAFVTLVNLRPTMPILEKLTHLMHHEKDMDVSSFVLGFMHELANSTVEPIFPLTKNFSDALKAAPGFNTEITRSFFKYFGKYWPEYKWGKAFSLTGIRGYPRYEGAAFNFDCMNAGQYKKNFELGYNMVGLGPFMDKLFGPKGVLTTGEKSIFDFFTKKQKDASPHSIIRNIFKELKIKERTTEFPAGHFYYKMYGYELGYFDFTDLVRDLTTKGKVPMFKDTTSLAEGLPFLYQFAGIVGNTKLTLPTAAGFPVSVWSFSSFNINTDGKFALSVKPYLLKEERNGQPPVTAEVSLELNAKATQGFKGDMGLDMFFTKATNGYHTVATFEAPIKERMAYDFTHDKFMIEHTNPKMEKPFLTVRSEPISERMTITTAKETPVVMHEKNVILVPYGERVKPLYVPYEFNTLGWKSLMIGQVPRTWSSLFMPLKGRTDVSFFWRAMENPSDTITLRGQFFTYISKAEALSKARTYEETLMGQREREDFDYPEIIDEDDVMKFDKFGRPLPTEVEDIIPATEPIDLDRETLSTPQIIRKIEKTIGKPMPRGHKTFFYGMLLTMDASANDVTRKCELIGWLNARRDTQWLKTGLHFSRRPITGYDEEGIEWVADVNFRYPNQVARPLDVLSVDFQRQILKELNYHLGFKTAKKVNEILNNTILSVIEQNDFSYLAKGPTYKILEALMPQHLYRMMNFTEWRDFPKNWIVYWDDLLPLFEQMLNEKLLSMDPYFLSREGMLHHKMEELLSIQRRLKKDIFEVIHDKKVNNAEIPVMQWLVMKQGQIVGFFSNVIAKDYQKGKIDHMKVFEMRLKMAYQNSLELTKLMGRVLQEVTFLTTKTNELGEPVVINSDISETPFYGERDFEEEEDIDTESGSWFGSVFGGEVTEEDEPTEVNDVTYKHFDHGFLWRSLYKLCLHQYTVVEELMEKMMIKQHIRKNTLEDLLVMYKRNMTLFNTVFKDSPINDEIIIDELLLLATQNEEIVWMVSYMKDLLPPENLPETREVKFPTFVDYQTLLFKLSGTEFANMVSYIVKDIEAREIMAPVMPEKYEHFWEQIQSVKRGLMVEMYTFRGACANNVTVLRDPELAEPLVREFISDINSFISTILGINTRMIETGGAPPLYLVTELMETIRACDIAVEYAEKSTLPVTYLKRLEWYESFAKLRTEIKTLMAKMNPLFTKLIDQPFKPTTDHIPVFDNVPVDLNIFNVENIVKEQKELKDRIVRFIQIRDEPIEVEQKVLEDAMERTVVLHEMLKQEKPRCMIGLETRTEFEISVISVTFSKAVTEQFAILDILKTCLRQKSVDLENIGEMEEKVKGITTELSEMENDFNNKLFHIENKDFGHEDTFADYPSQWEDETISYDVMDKKETRVTGDRIDFPTSIVGLVNITWGTKTLRDKQTTVKVMSMRSVEQVFRLYKQMHSLYRDPTLVKAINHQLQGRWFDFTTEEITDLLNTFNHNHASVRYNENEISDYWMNTMLWAKDWTKMYLWPHYELDDVIPELHNAKGEFDIVHDISDVNKKSDFYLMTPVETNKYMDVPHEYLLDSILPQNARCHGLDCIYKNYLGNPGAPKCFLNKHHIQTFDRVSYSLPVEGDKCEHLLAMDCSPLKSFAITMVKSNSSLVGHILRIVNEDKVVEVFPNFLDVDVKVNGESLILKDKAEPIKIRNQMGYEPYESSVIVSREGMKVTIELPLTGVTVTFIGINIQIEVSKMFQSRTCGLCSNFDTQRSWEYEGPKREVYTNPSTFVKSYAFPSCPVHTQEMKAYEKPHKHIIPEPELRSIIYRPKKAEPIFELKPEEKLPTHPSEDLPVEPSRKEKKECEPVLGYEVKDWRSKVRTETCITKHKVPKCPFDCLEKKDTKRERVEFICIDTKSPELPHIRHEIDNNKEINWDDYPRISQLKPRSRYYRVPEICTP